MKINIDGLEIETERTDIIKKIEDLMIENIIIFINGLKEKKRRNYCLSF